MAKKREDQINVVIDAEIRQAIDDIRAMRRPVPSVSDAIRQAILNERDWLKRKLAAQGSRQDRTQ